MGNSNGFRKYYASTILIGLGFFTVGMLDPIYDTYVPILLRNFIGRDGIVGGIMGLDNLFAILMIPVFSAMSDRTRTRIGRRMPYIIIALPLTALCFGLLPYSALTNVAILIGMITVLNLFKQSARGPVVALMPDIVPGKYRSEANGVINTMGGLAAIIGTVGLARLYDVDIVLPFLGPTRRVVANSAGSDVGYVGTLPFIVAGMLVLLAVILLFITVKEPATPVGTDEERVPIIGSLKTILGAQDRSVLLVLGGILLWFIGYQGVLPWIGIYGVNFLELSPGSAALSAGMVGIAYALFAIPSGVVAHKIGRRRVIRGSLVGIGVISLLLFLHQPLTIGLSSGIRIATFWGFLFLFGIFWGSVVTNSFPMLWQMANYHNIGLYTGLYYLFSQAAGVVAPILTGSLRDLFGERIVFLVCAVSMLTACLLMGGVTRGEAE